MLKYTSAILFILISCHNLYSQENLSPAVKTLQNELIQNYENIGYGDYEIDLLHKKIGLLISNLQDKFEKDENGESALKLEVTAGEAFRATGEHYIINGYAYLYPGENQTLKKVVLDYYRLNPEGNVYLREKRELVNPTPFFGGDKNVDTNDDITLSLYKTNKAEVKEELVRQIVFKDIDRHDRKMKLIESYKQYLRKTLNALERRIRKIKLDNATQLLFLLEFE